MISIERKLLKSIVLLNQVDSGSLGEELKHIGELKLSEEMFIDDQKNWMAFSYMLKHYMEFGDLPTEESILEKFGIDLSCVNANLNPLEYQERIIDRFVEHKVLTEAIPALQGYVKNHKIRHARRYMLDFVSRCDSWVREDGKAVSLSQSAMDRIASYKERKNSKSFGLPTPWNALDRSTLGVGNGELWFIIARQGVGKTWCSILFASVAYEAGKNILFVSMENPVDKIMMRWDALNAKIPYKDLRSSSLTPDDEKKYIEYVVSTQNRENDVDFVGDGKVTSPADVEVLLKSKKYDLVVIDGMYLMRMSQNYRDMYLEIGVVVNALQRIALANGVPILCTTQFARRGKSEDDVAYSQEIIRCADVALSLFADDKSLVNNERYVIGMKFRDASPVNLLVRWDLDYMNFDMISVVDKELKPVF